MLYKYSNCQILYICYFHHPDILLGTWQEVLNDWCKILLNKLENKKIDLTKTIEI